MKIDDINDYKDFQHSDALTRGQSALNVQQAIL